jgi:hypothetical protein
MNCPRCVREIPYTSTACGECGFSLHDQDALFGNDAVCLARVTNANNSFSEAQVKELDAALDVFERDFPQLFLAVYSVALPAMASLRQFAFWLLNRAAVPSLDITRPNENGSLLILDSTSGQAVLVVGYLLECYYPESELQALLEKGKPAWQAGKMAAGSLAVMEAFGKSLRKKVRVATKDPSRFAPKWEDEPTRPEFQRLHDAEETTMVEPAETPVEKS